MCVSGGQGCENETSKLTGTTTRKEVALFKQNKQIKRQQQKVNSKCFLPCEKKPPKEAEGARN